MQRSDLKRFFFTLQKNEENRIQVFIWGGIVRYTVGNHVYGSTELLKLNFRRFKFLYLTN